MTTQDWQLELKAAITDPAELCKLLALDPSILPVQPEVLRQFSLRVPPAFLKRIKPRNPQDPLLLQVLATNHELENTPGFSIDPLAEKLSAKAPGLLHKYHGRVLLVTTGGCAINCRYCFRRHFPYQEHAISAHKLSSALEYIKKDTSIFEVILSGGDPLILKDEQLAALVKQLEQIDHINYLRIHTRLPIMIPSRITSTLLTLLRNTRFQVSLVIHCNHAQEIDQSVTEALKQLRLAGVTLLNQAVLLKGINDTSVALINLSHALFRAQVLPYYLHLLDAVQGAAHFEVNKETALSLLHTMQASLPGYLVPKLVREEAGKKNKTWVTSEGC